VGGGAPGGAGAPPPHAVGVVYGRVGSVLLVAGGRRTVRTILTRDAVVVAVQVVGVARVAVVDLLSVLLIAEVRTVVAVTLRGALRPRRRKKHIIQHAATTNDTAACLMAPPLLRLEA
jgi:hypothetical protein